MKQTLEWVNQVDRISKHVVSLFVIMPTGPVFFNYYFCEAQIMVGRVYTTFYLPLLKIA